MILCNFFSRQRNNLIDALSSFTTFYKRFDQGARIRRQALDDLGAFTTFMKRDPKLSSNNKRSARSISREALRDALGTFSSFMDPYQYYKRVSLVLDSQDPVASSLLSLRAPELSSQAPNALSGNIFKALRLMTKCFSDKLHGHC